MVLNKKYKILLLIVSLPLIFCVLLFIKKDRLVNKQKDLTNVISSSMNLKIKSFMSSDLEHKYFKSFDLFTGKCIFPMGNSTKPDFPFVIGSFDGNELKEVLIVGINNFSQKLIFIQKGNERYSISNMEEGECKFSLINYYTDDKLIEVEYCNNIFRKTFTISTVDITTKDDYGNIRTFSKSFSEEDVIVGEVLSLQDCLKRIEHLLPLGTEEKKYIFYNKDFLKVYDKIVDGDGEVLLDEVNCYNLTGYDFFWWTISGYNMKINCD